MDWQQPLALAIVALAAIWLVRTQILAPRRGGCGGCSSGCSVEDKPGQESRLIQVDLELPRGPHAPD